MTEPQIRIYHGDDWMSITVSKEGNPCAEIPMSPLGPGEHRPAPAFLMDQQAEGVEPPFKRHYRRATRPSTDVMRAMGEDMDREWAEHLRDCLNRMYS